MRIASLVPSATEALFALGLGDDVVAVTHECDFPAAAGALPHLTRSVLAAGLSAADIDRQVRETTARGEALYELDEAMLAAAEPDLIVTQALCAVCAVSSDDVRAVAARLPSAPRVLSLDPECLDDVIGSLLSLGEATAAGPSAEKLAAALRRRIGIVAEAVSGAGRPSVAALEWLDPPFAGGHWVPEMIAHAGGRDALAEPRWRSREVDWEEIAAARPDVVVVMPCGLHAQESELEARRNQGKLEALGAGSCFAVDAAASFSRPGPRLVEGVELLGHLLHPGLVPAPAGIGWSRLWG